MIQQDTLVPIGRIFKPHGYKGEMKVDLYYGTDIFANPKTPFFTKIDNILVPFFVERIGGRGSRTFFVKLKGVDSDKAASDFTKKEIYAYKKDVAKATGLSEEELGMATDGLAGYEIYDNKTGVLLGTSEGIEEGVEYDYLLMKRNRKDGQILHIPFIDEFIDMVTPASDSAEPGRIAVTLPEGMIDL